MKKIAIFTALSLFVATSAFAAASLTLALDSTGKTLYGVKSGTASSTSPSIGKTSTGVGLGMKVDATAGAGYALETQHKNGTKAYGSAFDSTSVYSKDVTAGQADTTGYGTTGSDAFGTGWSTL